MKNSHCRPSGINSGHRFCHARSLKCSAIFGMTAGAGIGAPFVSGWFVEALKPAMDGLGINEVFSGLIILAMPMTFGGGKENLG